MFEISKGVYNIKKEKRMKTTTQKSKNVRGKFTTAEKFFIEGKFGLMRVEDIAAELKRTVKSVEKYIQENRIPLNVPNKEVVVATSEVKPSEPPKPTSLSLEQMCPKTPEGESRGMAIMTEGASTLADDFTKKNNKKLLPKFGRNIHKPK